MENKYKAIVIDVDGTMTDGGIYYAENGVETKKFCTKDAAGFFVLKQLGIEILIISGRECKATLRRMSELGITSVFQNVKDKYSFIQTYMLNNNIKKEELAYIGDDLNDLPSMKLAGYVGCPEDACKEIKSIADYISNVKGGFGAVRDIVENGLVDEISWEKAIGEVYKIGI